MVLVLRGERARTGPAEDRRLEAGGRRPQQRVGYRLGVMLPLWSLG